MKKLFVLTVLFSCICAIAAEIPFKKWTIADVKVRKNIANHVSRKDGVLKLDGSAVSFNYFKLDAIPVNHGCRIIITGKASGKGSVNIGYMGYLDKNFRGTGREYKKVTLNAQPKPFKCEFIMKNIKTGTIRPSFIVAKNSEVNVSDYKVEVISTAFDGWLIMDPAMRSQTAKLISKTATGAKFISKEKNYGYFGEKGFPAEVGQTVRISGKISGKGTATCALFSYVDDKYRVTGYSHASFKVTEQPTEFNIEFKVTKPNSHHCRPVINIGKNTEVTITDYKITIEK